GAMDPMKAKRVQAKIEIEFPSEDVAKVVYEAVLYEHLSVPYRRSEIDFKLEGKKIILDIKATDSSALRGTVNSYLRWIKAAIDVIEV
uniref:Uncharacterized protein n=1 Tax=Pyrococcus furiosus (strain ATCC 43587 / DSM 3638 / JCM 8422 / Vc1) TaxID=186497 RepID=UPI0008029538|nr:Chain D, Uncharacterized protein [Pyrococcus furiosus DSM 3638]5JMV_E Chain E, Uncharacterized protein [Pyrococcus furiosus DSM 3638]5JMV_F Chain F, Uncharacterized protein [Pyrococcus furiosus DSM 3638]5JMV_G Chain G, Uncharacterized protein [Pyrococcus furiosus DSM 3638]5JMV_H Chain H, Uncharacterized protein [Pyrococcus furiosus DSM 3638]